MIALTNNATEIVGDVPAFEAKLEKLNNTVCLDKIEDRLMRVHFWNKEEAAAVREDFVRFAGLTFLRPQIEIVPTKKIDEFWHTFLIFTQMYLDWCEKNWGPNFFFHHVPGHKGDGSWEMTRDLARNVYGVEWKDSAQALSCGCNIPNPKPAAVPRS
jgi:hypothetical protein